MNTNAVHTTGQPLWAHPAGTPNVLRRVVVTGATGLLGGSVVAELLARSINVVAIVRDRDRARRALGDHDRLQLVVGDVINADALIPALHDADAIIHTAAYFREYYQPRFDPSLLERTNVTAVAQLVAAADQADVPVFVQVSSAGTIGPTPPEEPAGEDTPPGKSSRRNHYYASKVRADQLVEALRDKHTARIPVVVAVLSTRCGCSEARPKQAARITTPSATAPAPAPAPVASVTPAPAAPTAPVTKA